MMVAEGSVDICAEPELSLWDMAANAIIVQEAGGRFTGLDGVDGPGGGNAAASNGALHRELLGVSEPALLSALRRSGGATAFEGRAAVRAPPPLIFATPLSGRHIGATLMTSPPLVNL